MVEGATLGRCPLCGRPTALEARPFCSRRCADIDLGRWLGGRYVVSRPDDRDETDDVPQVNGSRNDVGG